jgi:hypothetical protein
MPKKHPPSRSFLSDPEPSHGTAPDSRYVPDWELWLYARSFHMAARKLAGALEPDSGPDATFDASPVIFLYRHALELHLKALVLGGGSNFLETKPDTLSIRKTHSIPWLAQFISQIITTVGWEQEFKCEGIESVADFKAFIDNLNLVDPGSYVCRWPVDPDALPSVREFARKVDAFLDLLASTADALAAEWDIRSEAAKEGHGNDGGFKPTIQ